MEKFAEAFERYTREQPLPWSDFFIARGGALAAFGHGRRDAPEAESLKHLSEEAERHGFKLALAPMRNALSDIDHASAQT